MTNFERYKDEILNIAKIGLVKITKSGEITTCSGKCNDCILYPEEVKECRNELIEWLYAEVKPNLTAKERAFCEIVNEGYIARDKDGELYIYANEPPKRKEQWCSDVDFIPLNNEYFSFIIWEDEKPWSIEELLKLEVEE